MARRGRGPGSLSAILAGERKIPEPIVDPMRIATPVQTPILRGSNPRSSVVASRSDDSSTGKGVVLLWTGSAIHKRYCKGPQAASSFEPHDTTVRRNTFLDRGSMLRGRSGRNPSRGILTATHRTRDDDSFIARRRDSLGCDSGRRPCSTSRRHLARDPLRHG